jgi:thymidine phosphorylase
MSAVITPSSVIATKRDGAALSAAQVQHVVQGLVDGGWADSQVAALAMAIVLRGMDTQETVALTTAMTHSGEVLRWDDAGLDGPVLDKHSTGGVGDKVSLMLAPLVAACGGVVPMISGRGLGHTGGTLDKLEALPGYRTQVDHATLHAALRSAGCAIVGASAQVAPADRRLYAIRDVTATVESVPLITASILSKKLAAGLQGLVLDVKVGSGAFMATLPQAQALAHSLVDVANGAGLPTRALVTDMNQVLGSTAGNALEVQEALDFLTGRQQEPRLLALTLDLAAELLHLGELAPTPEAARGMAQRALDSGAAADRFARMVAALGGPRDVLRDPQLPAAPVQRPVPAPRDAVLSRTDVRALGECVVQLGGGRRRPGDAVDPRVGLSQVLPLHTPVQTGQTVAIVHAASEAAADQACREVLAACGWSDAESHGAVAAAANPVLQRLGG